MQKEWIGVIVGMCFARSCPTPSQLLLRICGVFGKEATPHESRDTHCRPSVHCSVKHHSALGRLGRKLRYFLRNLATILTVAGKGGQLGHNGGLKILRYESSVDRK
jgi:hypothetical protein